MDIREKLKFIDAIAQPVARVKKEQAPVKLEQFIEGKYISTPYGSCFSTEKVFSRDHIHGNTAIANVTAVEPEIWKYIGKDERLRSMNLERVLFFDTETTGLSGGAGTYIFLAGFGYFNETGLIVKQFFMSDFNEELAFLYAVNELMRDFTGIISYNGKSYDWPLLQSRFIYSRLSLEMINPAHLDLLHTARRLWKKRLNDCSLNNIERNILNFQRVDDIPGHLIPFTFFQYLREKNITPLIPVFQHNQLDILSLAALLHKAVHIFTQPTASLNDYHDLTSLAQTYETMSEWHRSIDIYEKLLTNNAARKEKHQIALQLSYCYKHLGKWDKAAALWQQFIDQGLWGIDSYVELAKYYEHRLQNYEQAIRVVRRAIESLEITLELSHDAELVNHKAALVHRLNRNLRKMEAQSNGADSSRLDGWNQ